MAWTETNSLKPSRALRCALPLSNMVNLSRCTPYASLDKTGYATQRRHPVNVGALCFFHFSPHNSRATNSPSTTSQISPQPFTPAVIRRRAARSKRWSCSCFAARIASKNILLICTPSQLNRRAYSGLFLRPAAPAIHQSPRETPHRLGLLYPAEVTAKVDVGFIHPLYANSQPLTDAERQELQEYRNAAPEAGEVWVCESVSGALYIVERPFEGNHSILSRTGSKHTAESLIRVIEAGRQWLGRDDAS